MNVIHELKEATHSLHKELDTHPLNRKLLSNDLDIDSYRQILTNLYHWQHYMQPRVSRLSLQTFHFLQVPAMKFLEKDMSNLEMTKPLTYPHSGQAIGTFGYQLGCLYVLQNASLGGQVIAPKVEKTLQMEDICHYFWGPKEQTMPYWRQTDQALERAGKDKEIFEDMIIGAQESIQEMITLNQESIKETPIALEA
jgi:heme oxygenase